jgi:hypothetical protein
MFIHNLGSAEQVRQPKLSIIDGYFSCFGDRKGILFKYFESVVGRKIAWGFIRIHQAIFIFAIQSLKYIHAM